MKHNLKTFPKGTDEHPNAFLYWKECFEKELQQLKIDGDYIWTNPKWDAHTRLLLYEERTKFIDEILGENQQ